MTPPDVLAFRSPTAEEQRARRATYWQNAFTEALGKGWMIVASDGESREFDGRARPIVNVACTQGEVRGVFTLVPKEWPAEDLPARGALGINGANSQGARRFYLEGELPDDFRRKVVEYFGLE
jgi:hypothetical protein